jgi:hypothetical protein
MWKEMESIGRTIRWISTMMSRGEGGYFGGVCINNTQPGVFGAITGVCWDRHYGER